MHPEIRQLFGGESDGCPDIDIPRWERKPSRHHAQNRIFLVIQQDCPAYHLRISSKSALPQPVTDESDMFCPWTVLLRSKHAPYDGLRPQNGKDILRSGHPAQLLRLSLAPGQIV